MSRTHLLLAAARKRPEPRAPWFGAPTPTSSTPWHESMESLECAQVSAVVDPADGGRLASLRLAGTEILASPAAVPGLPESWFHGCFPMAPFAGRVGRGRFEFDGTCHELPINAGEDAAHGLVEDVRWSVVSRADTRLTLSCELDSRWPYGGQVEQTFELTESSLTMTLTAINDIRAMPTTLGFHPWFRRDAGTGGPATYVVLPGARYVSDSHGGLPSLIADLGPRPWDDVFALLEAPPTIYWPGGPTIRITSNRGTWTIFERLADAFCIEPLTAAPGSLGRDPMAVVCPGNPLVLTMRLSWLLPESQ